MNIAVHQTVQPVQKTPGTLTVVLPVITFTAAMVMSAFCPTAVLWDALQCAFAMMVSLWTTTEIACLITRSVDHVTAAKMKNGQLNGVTTTLAAVQVVSLISLHHGHFVLWSMNVSQEWRVVDVHKIMPGIHEQAFAFIKTSVANHHSVLRMKFMLMLQVLVMSQIVKDGAVALQDGLRGNQGASVLKDTQD